MAQVLAPPKRDTQMDALAGALNIAGSIFGIKGAMEKSQVLDVQLQQEKLALEKQQSETAERQALAQGLATPLGKRQLQMQGFSQLNRDALQKLGPEQRQALNILEFREQVGEQDGKPVYQPIFFAKVPRAKTQFEAQKEAGELAKLGAETELKQAQAKKTLFEAEGGMLPREIRKEQQLISKQLGSAQVPELSKTLDKIDSFLVTRLKIPDGIDTTGSIPNDIPGFGISSFLPGKGLTTEGKEFRQLVAGLKNTVLKMRSGGAVTPDEGKRLIEEIEGAGTDKALLAGIRNFRDTVQSAIENTYAGVSEEAVKAYASRGGVDLNKMSAFNRQFLAEGPTTPSGGKQTGNMLPFLEAVNQVLSGNTADVRR